tara:strand:- start:49 stop:822 length:774 start_codon:yes stop_codon:yes gene_type:complete
MDNLENNKKKLNELKSKITAHPLFANNLEPKQICKFMESHIFAVWGFMSILKSLQKMITPNNLPWMPNKNTKNGLVNFVNEIILCEESDYIEGIGFISHFEIYLLAMKNMGARNDQLDKLTSRINNKGYNEKYLDSIDATAEVKSFLKHDLEVSMNGTLPEIVGAFTLGREKVIPNMFGYILPAIKETLTSKYLITYLERHIDIDGDRHGPLSMKLLNASCGKKEELSLAYATAIKSLELRLMVWDKVYEEISVDII